MSSTFSLDPSYGIAKAFIKIGRVFCALMATAFGYMVYLAYQGIMLDWNLSIKTPFFDYFPPPNSVAWHMIFFSSPAIGFIISFFLLGWLGKKIDTEDQTQKLTP